MKIFFLFILLCPALNAFSQTETEIRNHYQDVNARIQESIEHGFEGSLYCNEWVTNKNSKSWPALGIFRETTAFWYDDDPNHISIEERDPRMVLLKVTVNRKSSALITNEEYLYKNARLVFYYCREGEGKNLRETRAYFNAKGMFKSITNINGTELPAADLAKPEYRDLKLTLASIRKYGKSYQDLFTGNRVYR